jgi:hypothetical protein
MSEAEPQKQADDSPQATRPRSRVLIEGVGLLGVVLSLVFVGVEIRQNTTAMRAATLQAVTSQVNDLNLAIATDSELAVLAARMLDGDLARDDLSFAEQARLDFVIIAAMRRVENIFLQVEAGTLEQEALDRVGLSFYANPCGRESWSLMRGGFDAQFSAWFDAKLKSVPEEEEAAG